LEKSLSGSVEGTPRHFRGIEGPSKTDKSSAFDAGGSGTVWKKKKKKKKGNAGKDKQRRVVSEKRGRRQQGKKYALHEIGTGHKGDHCISWTMGYRQMC